jgi:hypothetical protein
VLTRLRASKRGRGSTSETGDSRTVGPRFQLPWSILVIHVFREPDYLDGRDNSSLELRSIVWNRATSAGPIIGRHCDKLGTRGMI